MNLDSWHSLQYRLHARIGILSGVRPAVQLWYALRALDMNGSGKVSITMAEAMSQLGRSRTTIWRYLKDTTFFRSHTTKDGMLTIYLQGLRSVCKSLGLVGIGPIGFNEGLDSIQKDSASIGAQFLQQCSMFLAVLASQKTNKLPNTLDATLLENTSFISGGVPSPIKGASQCIGTLSINTVSGSPQTVHVLHQYTTPYGASIEGIADLLGVCAKTISRSLKGSIRIRQAQQISYIEYYSKRQEAKENLGRMDGFYSLHREYGAYRLYTYLYYPQYHLCSQRVLKSHVNPHLRLAYEGLRMGGGI
jgi:hypothetical protein